MEVQKEVEKEKGKEDVEKDNVEEEEKGEREDVEDEKVHDGVDADLAEKILEKLAVEDYELMIDEDKETMDDTESDVQKSGTGDFVQGEEKVVQKGVKRKLDDTETDVQKSGRGGKCPKCGKYKSYLVRHLRITHKWDELKIKTHRQRFQSQSNPLRPCPVVGCSSVMCRFNDHFRKITSREVLKKLYAILRSNKKDEKEPEETKPKEEKPDIRVTRKKILKIDLEGKMDSVSEDESVNAYSPEDDKEETSIDEDDLKTMKEKILLKSEFGCSLQDFKQYLQRPEGGRKSASLAKEDTSRVATLLQETLGKQPIALIEIFSKELPTKMWNNFFGRQLEKYSKSLEDGTSEKVNIRKPSTLQNYSSTLESYCNFLLAQALHRDAAYPLSKEMRATV